MTLDRAAYIAAARDAGFLFPEVSGRLLELKATTRGEELERATRALVHFDPERFHVPEPAWSFVCSVADVVVAVLYSTDRATRSRLVNLLQRLVEEASSVRRSEQAALAAQRVRLAAAAESDAWQERERAAERWRDEVAR